MACCGTSAVHPAVEDARHVWHLLSTADKWVLLPAASTAVGASLEVSRDSGGVTAGRAAEGAGRGRGCSLRTTC